MPLLLLLGSCLQIGTGNDTDAGASPVTSGATGDAEAGVPTGGTGCAIDSVSGTTLCSSLDRCPGLQVDHDVFPDCGFRIPSTIIDLECVCGDFLCPVGAALDCAQAKSLLADQSEMVTCVQQNEGRCAPRASTTAKPTSCDSNCADSCAGDINCRKLCGC